MEYFNAFWTGGLICALVQILLDRTKLMPGRIMVLLVCTGSVLSAVGIYQPFAEFAGAGASVPLLGFGNILWKGMKESIDKNGLVGLFMGGFTACAVGVSADLIFSYLASLIFKPNMKGYHTMSDSLYLQLDQNIQINHPHIYLQDIAKLSCSNSKILNRLRVMPVINLDPNKPGRYVMSVMDLISEIKKKEPDLEISNIGEADFIITFKNKPGPGLVWQWCKIIFVGLAAFFGAGFSIMTFNNDVDVGGLFSQIYTQVTGQTSGHFTVLEITYSIGIGLGVLFFFNHFGHMKITDDPTPMQIQMRLYEENVNKTLIKDIDRTSEK